MSILDFNQTEMQKISSDEGILLPKTMSTEKMIEALSNEKPPKSCRTLEPEQQSMEAHIQRYFRRLKSQLPGCTGRCTTHGCPDIVVSSCWNTFKDHII